MSAAFCADEFLLRKHRREEIVVDKMLELESKEKKMRVKQISRYEGQPQGTFTVRLPSDLVQNFPPSAQVVCCQPL